MLARSLNQANCVFRSITRLLLREDFRREPIKALVRRISWRVKWITSSVPFQITIADNDHIFVSKTGAGALLFYQGSSDPHLRTTIRKLLKPGEVFFDIGAHLGEFSVLASRIVSDEGQVHLFEPIIELYRLIDKSVTTNHLSNVISNCIIVSDKTGLLEFEVKKELALSGLSGNSLALTNSDTSELRLLPSLTLDEYILGKRKPDVIKVDVEGAELNVLMGAHNLIELPESEAPIWILEYSPDNYRKLGYSEEMLLNYMNRHGYRFFHLSPSLRFSYVSNVTSIGQIDNIIASKQSIANW